MKMKQVCQLTGLTERTIRFYVEKELCAPETRWMDQRKYYDFSKCNTKKIRPVLLFYSLPRLLHAPVFSHSLQFISPKQFIVVSRWEIHKDI